MLRSLYLSMKIMEMILFQFTVSRKRPFYQITDTQFDSFETNLLFCQSGSNFSGNNEKKTQYFDFRSFLQFFLMIS